nr:Coenzyme Q-binding protein COQ10, START domain containing protein [Ipomoea batatas]
MSATSAVVPVPAPAAVSLNGLVNLHQTPVPLFTHFPCPRKSAAISSSFISRYSNHGFLSRKVSHTSLSGLRIKPLLSPVMEWQDCTVKMDIDVPTSIAYKCYADREAIPQWMPFISSVKISTVRFWRTSLTYLDGLSSIKAFGQDIEFSWLARNMQPIPNQKIHWRSLEGLPNRGAVRFYPKGASSCTVELTVSYEVPPLLTPVASALQPFLESLLVRGLERFAKFAKGHAAAQQ